jgi:hypothetical protein
VFYLLDLFICLGILLFQQRLKQMPQRLTSYLQMSIRSREINKKMCSQCGMLDTCLYDGDICTLCDFEKCKVICIRCGKLEFPGFIGVCCWCNQTKICPQCGKLKFVQGKVCHSCRLKNDKELCPECGKLEILLPSGVCIWCK